MWGLLFYNDDGEMMEACFTTGYIGGRPTYLGQDAPADDNTSGDADSDDEGDDGDNTSGGYDY